MKKNITVKQRDIKDCGACCLLSIIKYYNGNINLDKIRIDSCTTKNGITAYNLIIAAKKYGFDAKGIKITFNELVKAKILLPAIAYLELKNGLRHYVVIYQITKKYIHIMDPAKGLIKVSYEEFQRDFQEVLLILSPITEIVKYNDKNTLLEIFFKLLNKEKKLIINLFISSIILTIVSIISSFYFKIILSSITTFNNNYILFIILIFSIIILLKVILEYLKNYYITYLSKNIDANILPTFLHHILSLPLNAISNRTTGEIVTRVHELNNIKELYSNMLVSLILNLLLAISSWFVLYFIDNKLTIILFIVILIYLLNNLIWITPINNLVEDNLNKETTFNSYLNNTLTSITTTKSYSYLGNRLEERLIDFQKNTFFFNKKISIYQFINNFIIEIGLFILNTTGIYLVMNNNLELLDLITYNSLYLYFIDPIKELIGLIPKYSFIHKSFQKVNDFLMLEKEKVVNKEEEFINGDIEFENITFSYNLYDYPIKNYNLKINKNSSLLIMGKSGCGKSSLFKLLYRLYEPLKGTIKINNINIKDYSLKTLRDNIALISQDEQIYNDTLLNNITMGTAISLQNLNKILEICDINDILAKKALRLDTFIMEDGSNLSGGEKSRIFIARALVKNKSIMIFDETFSAIAKKDAEKMIKSICEYYKNRTIIIISHFKPNYKFDQIIEGDLIND